MSTITEQREKQIEELDAFIQTTQKRLKTIVSNLSWTLESVSEKSQNMVTCPFDDGHRIRESSLEDHLEKCQWKAEGYGINELPLSEPCSSVNSSSTIKFDEQLQDTVLLRAKQENPMLRIDMNAIATAAGVADRLIPRTSDRLTASFTSDERKAIYDYAIANTITPDIGDDIADMNRLTQKAGDQPKTSLLELLAQERNLKRRRAKHRGVHTNKKSQVEILREVINQQMEMYEEYLADTSIKSEPKSPSKSETSSLDFRTGIEERKSYQKTSREPEFPGRIDGKNLYAFSNDFRSDREKKSDRSESRDNGRRKHSSKHKRDRSKGRSRERHHSREEKTWNRDAEVYKSEDKTDRKKRHRSRDKSSKYDEKEKRRRDKSSDKYYREDRKFESDKNRKRKY